MRLPLTTVVALALVISTTTGGAAQDSRRITVVGTAEVAVPPDLASVRVGVETEAEAAADALAENGTAMQAVFDALEAEGIAAADIQTSQLYLAPVYDRRPTDTDEPALRGYQASNVVEIRVRALDRLGAVIDAVAQAGANRIDSIGFEIAEPRPHLDRAREAAVADARAKADLLAEAAGVSLGSVMTIDENPPQGGPGPLRARAEMAMDVPVAEGTLAVGASVEVVYAIE